jgi:AraC family transcriptional regulator, exoenzyme S synthesis regulatory protein ExsA
MREYILPVDLLPTDSQSETAQISILHYNSNVVSIKNRITFRQNLFSFLLEGEKTVQYAGKQEKITPDQFLLLSTGNCLMSENIASEGGTYRSILLFFDNLLLTDFLTRYPSALQPRQNSLIDDPYLVFEKDAFLNNFVESLSHIIDADQPLSAKMRALKLEELLLYLSEVYPGKIEQLRNMSQRADDEILIRQAITASIDHPATVEEMAFLCHMSLSTFKRRFANIYGTSPNKWLLEKRMQKAAKLLKQGAHNVSDIYYELGYENLSSFIQSFKQVYGVTPKQYQLSE